MPVETLGGAPRDIAAAGARLARNEQARAEAGLRCGRTRLVKTKGWQYGTVDGHDWKEVGGERSGVRGWCNGILAISAASGIGTRCRGELAAVSPRPVPQTIWEWS